MDSQSGIMDSNDVSNSVDDGKVLKASGIDDNLGPVLLVLWIQSWVDHFNWADESVTVDFVWESGIRDNTGVTNDSTITGVDDQLGEDFSQFPLGYRPENHNSAFKKSVVEPAALWLGGWLHWRSQRLR